MHPEHLHALVRLRHAELLRYQRRKRAGPAARPVPPRSGAWHRARRSVGAALVVAGTRLHGRVPGGVELFESRR